MERREKRGGETKRTLQAATSRRRSATSAAGKRKEQSKSPAGNGEGIAVEHGVEITGGNRNRSRAPGRNHRVDKGLIVEHGNEITAVERRKKIAKEVESGGVETKEDERSKKKMLFRGHLRISLI